MEIETRHRTSPFGVKVIIEAGVVSSVEEIGIPKGTRVEIRDLFYTTPVRLKFLRSSSTEWGHIQDVFVQVSLSRKDIHFQLWKGGKHWFNAPPSQDLHQRIGQIMGWELAEKLYPLETWDGEYRLYGMMARPDFYSVTGRNIFFFVNRRPVRDLLLQKALREAYRTYMPKDKFPVVFLFLELPSDQVDVNVHPSKREVRFVDPLRIRSLFQETLIRRLKEAPWDRKAISPITVRDVTPRGGQPAPNEEWERKDTIPIPFFNLSRKDTEKDVGRDVQSETTNYRVGGTFSVNGSFREMKISESQEALWIPGHGAFSSLHVLGQFHEAFLVCESADHLILIDQHAAHERIVFEKLRNDFTQLSIEQQALLLPRIVELSPRESDVVMKYLPDLCSWGIEVEHYGRDSFAIKTLPTLLSNADPSLLLRDIAEELAEMERSQWIEDLRDHVFARMACHSVIRGQRHMAIVEIQALLKEMDQVDFSLHCPHGRPVMIAWSLYEIHKRFHRT
jgi:DNA mismatch repair protein MutL